MLSTDQDCGVPCENIYVNNVTCAHAHGLTIGSEIASGIRNVTCKLTAPINVPGSIGDSLDWVVHGGDLQQCENYSWEPCQD